MIAPPVLRAAELEVAPAIGHAQTRAAVGCDCGCGDLRVARVYHRESLATYGLGFDPRNDDPTQPHYYFGRLRAYPRYYVSGRSIDGRC